MRATFSVQKDFYEISWNFLDNKRSLSKRLTGLFGSERVFVHVTMICVNRKLSLNSRLFLLSIRSAVQLSQVALSQVCLN